ncbi:extracellular solute-binding protein [Streptococcus halichoeri]|uniref:extracellular solute-binding protein n=1 Tax=Streptococcus halichoeri TaxID=254785 RepID=UPI0013583CB6|nr:extracellular solute-binding protein [Streptococcus halichoeri]
MNFKKVFSKISILSVIFLTACSAGSTEKSDDEKTAKVDVKEALSSKPDGTKIVLASNNGGTERKDYILPVLKEAGFDVEFVDMGGADATARVIAEVENPTINVIWGPTMFNFDDMIKADALIKWEPTWVSDVARYDRKNGYSYPYEVQPKFWLANPDVVNEKNAPKTINELIDSDEFKGKYTIPTQFGGTTNRAIVASILGQYLDENGEEGVSQKGWDLMKKFIKNGTKTPDGEDLYVRMMDNTTPIAFDGASNIVANIKDLDSKPYIMYFENGQPSNNNEIGVVANKDSKVVAESVRLANYLGSSEFMADYASKFGNLVANESIQDKMDPMSAEMYSNFKEQDLDWSKINPLLDKWIAKIELEYAN